MSNPSKIVVFDGECVSSVHHMQDDANLPFRFMLNLGHRGSLTVDEAIDDFIEKLEEAREAWKQPA